MTPPPTRVLRDLTQADIDWVAEQEARIFGPAAWSRTSIEHGLRLGLARYRGVEVEGQLVAYSVLGSEGDAPHLMNLAVVPEARGHGHAKALVEDFLAEARLSGAEEAWLEVGVTNDAAVALYRKYGFDIVRVRSRYYQPEDVDALVMRVRLNPSA